MKPEKRAWEIGASAALLLVVLVCGSTGVWWMDRPRRLTEQLSKELNSIKANTLDAGGNVSLAESHRLHQLVREGARPSWSPYDATPLAVAASAGDLVFVHELIERGAKVRGGSEGSLIAAARAGHRDMVDLLITNGADVNAASGGVTPLMAATIFGEPAIIRSLVESGAKVNTRDGHGRTALNWSVGYGHPDVVTTLIDLGADPSLEDNSHKTPLQNAIRARDARKKQGLSPALQARWDRTVDVLQGVARQ